VTAGAAEDPARAPASAPTRRWWTGPAKALLGLGLVALVIGLLAPEAGDLSGRLAAGLSLPLLLLGLVGSAVAVLVTARRWQFLAEALGGTPLPYGVYVHALALTRVLGQFSSNVAMDLVGRGVALRAAGSQRGLGHAVLPVLLERVLDLLLPLCLLAWVVAAHAAGWRDDPLRLWGSLALSLVAFVLVATAALVPLARGLLRLYLRWRTSGGDDAPSSVPIGRRGAATVVTWSVLRFAALTLQYWAIGAGVGVRLPPFDMLAAGPVAQITGLLGVTPGGLGVQEAGWAGSLRWLGHDDAAIVLFMAAARLFFIVNFAVIAAVSVPWRRAPARAAAPDPAPRAAPPA
jgi:uncharacterized membrane protein YbhN (UPF0104 family)